jgi:hypothetical protein
MSSTELTHPDAIKSTVMRIDSMDPPGVSLGMQITLMSVDIDGMEWLDENAPGWREKVGAVKLCTKIFVSSLHLAAGPKNVMDMLKSDLVQALAEKIVELQEPELTGDWNATRRF